MIVADTNLIAYLMIPGEHSPEALRVFSLEPHWLAPLLWRSEFRNILALTMRTRSLSIAQAKEIMSKSEALFRDAEYTVASARVLELGHESGCSAYDCEFVALAEELGLQLVTNDRPVLRAFPKIAVSIRQFAAG